MFYSTQWEKTFTIWRSCKLKKAEGVGHLNRSLTQLINVLITPQAVSSGFINALRWPFSGSHKLHIQVIIRFILCA